MDPMNRRRIITNLKRHAIVPVIRHDESDLARQTIDLLGRAGFETFEVTLTTPDAIDIIAELDRDTFTVGAGTVLSLADARRCLEAGAEYLVSPCLIDGLVDMCHEAGAACLLGAMTPTEVHVAWNAGADAVKIFPASSVDGPRHLRSLRSIFPDTPLVPTGGVNIHNLAEYFRAGASFVGVGSDLVDERALIDGNTAQVLDHASRFLDLVHDLPRTDTPRHRERNS